MTVCFVHFIRTGINELDSGWFYWAKQSAKSALTVVNFLDTKHGRGYKQKLGTGKEG
jgi:hypothetical protein